MTKLRRGCRGCGEEGAALLIVLAFLSLFGLAIAALLGFSETSFKTTLAVRSLSGAKYAADGAAEAAINTWRDQTSVGAAGGSCPSFTPPVVNDTATRVECTAFNPTAGSAGVQVTSVNKPKAALLTLGRNSGEDGLSQGSNSNLRIKGQVYSNSTVRNTASSAQIIVDGPLIARGDCTGNITSTPAKSCNDTTANPVGVDPNYTPAATTVPPYRTVPTCSPNSVVTFQPGYYDDAAALSSMMSATGPCAGSVFWFQPGSGGVGVYYFDFHGATRTWTVKDSNARVIAGTPKGWSPTPASPAPTVTVPGACSTPLDGVQPGVQFIFGNDSRMDVQSGQVEICAQPSSTAVPVAVYGLKSGTETTTTATLIQATTASSPAGQFASPANAISKDNLVAAAAVADSATASMDLTGFAPPGTIPAGSVITDAKLRVAHRDERVGNGNAQAVESLTATLKVNRTGAPAIPGVAVTVGNDDSTSAIHEETYGVPLTALALEAKQYGLTGLSVSYATVAKNNKSAVESLDSIRLDLTYTPPALQAEDKVGSCVGAPPYVPGTNCALITTDGAQSSFYIHGTFYAPKAALDISLTNVSQQVFTWGLIVRSLRLNITPSSLFSQPTIQVPDDTSSSARKIILTAYVCPGQSSCPAGSGTARVRAKVTFNDGTTVPPKVESWSVLS